MKGRDIFIAEWIRKLQLYKKGRGRLIFANIRMGKESEGSG